MIAVVVYIVLIFASMAVWDMLSAIGVWHALREGFDGAAMRRLRYALLAALPVLTLIAIRSVYLSGYCFPGCSIYTPDNPEYFLFLCYLC